MFFFRFSLPLFFYRRLFGFIFLFSISVTAQNPSQNNQLTEKSVVTAELLLKHFSSTGRTPQAKWLANSRKIVFETGGETFSQENKERWIELLDVDSGQRKRLVRGTNPHPSPDGTKISYLISEGESTEIRVKSTLADEEPRSIAEFTKAPGIYAVSWSLDSRRIAYVFRPAAKPKNVAQTPASTVRVIAPNGDIPPDSEIWIADIKTKESKKVYSGSHNIYNLSWFPDNKSLLFTAVRTFQYFDDSILGEVRSLSLDTGKTQTLIKDAGIQSLRPVISPDGSEIAFTFDPTNIIYPEFWNIAVTPAAGGKIRQLTHGIFISSAPEWTPDKSKIFFTCKKGAFSQICSVTLDGKLRQLTNVPQNASKIDISSDGNSIIWTSEDAQGRTEIRLSGIDGSGERVLIDFTPEIKNLVLGDVQEIRWKSRDGLEIAGLLIKPVGYQRGKKYPLWVDLHGGPVGGINLAGSILNSSPLEWHLWAVKGFVVLVPDYRSSAVYGWKYVLSARKNQDANERDFDDIMSGVDYVQNLGLVNQEKMVLSGHSYGSVLTNWIITHTQRFTVAVSYEGWADNYLAYGTGLRTGGNSIFEWLYSGKPWEVPENYRKSSSTEYVKDIKTPTMFVSGDTNAAPLFHNEFLYTALKKQNVDTVMLVYRGEGHVIQKPENQRDLLLRVINWINKHFEISEMKKQLINENDR